MAQIYIIHPIDENLQFLYKIVKAFSQEFPAQVKYLRLSNNLKSHSDCLSAITKANREDVIFFLCHGRSDGLLGCRFRVGYPEHRRKYDHGLLIDASNISIFQDKKIFCLACDSNKVARLAIEAGVAVFVGFDDIRINSTDDQHVRSNAKTVLGKIVLQALRQGINNKLTFYEVVDYLKLLMNKQNDELILSHKGHRGYNYYVKTANIIQEIKEGIKIWGDGTLHFG